MYEDLLATSEPLLSYITKCFPFLVWYFHCLLFHSFAYNVVLVSHSLLPSVCSAKRFSLHANSRYCCLCGSLKSGYIYGSGLLSAFYWVSWVPDLAVTRDSSQELARRLSISSNSWDGNAGGLSARDLAGKRKQTLRRDRDILSFDIRAFVVEYCARNMKGNEGWT